MKIWSAEHTFDHPWETIVQAAWRKYPNPMNPSVTGIDVIDRKVDKHGVLKTHRLMTTQWGLPSWAIKIVGMEESCFVSEHSEVDQQKKIMKMRSRNLTFANFVTIDEQLKYEPHPTEKDSTLMTQESVIAVRGVPLTSYMESIIIGNLSNNAHKGRQGMDWVCRKIKAEAAEICQGIEKGMKSIDTILPSNTSL